MKNAYEVRDADYGIIHQEQANDVRQFVLDLKISQGHHVLDLGGGYGTSLEYILENIIERDFSYSLIDNSEHQIKKAQAHLRDKLISNPQVQSDFRLLDARDFIADAKYNTIICKMFLHEIPREDKLIVLNSIYDALLPGGQMIIWKPYLTEITKDFYSKVIWEKDRLAGYDSMVANRDFVSDKELTDLIGDSRFKSIELLRTFEYKLYTKYRLRQEFGGDMDKLRSWNRKIMQWHEESGENQEEAQVTDIGADDLLIRFKRGIYKAVKD